MAGRGRKGREKAGGREGRTGGGAERARKGTVDPIPPVRPFLPLPAAKFDGVGDSLTLVGAASKPDIQHRPIIVRNRDRGIDDLFVDGFSHSLVDERTEQVEFVRRKVLRFKQRRKLGDSCVRGHRVVDDPVRGQSERLPLSIQMTHKGGKRQIERGERGPHTRAFECGVRRRPAKEERRKPPSSCAVRASRCTT